ncbi:LOG family protein [Nocardioides bizhenqiangii]|uniref:Rossmann fold nucleotide-binding protein n=1 Tax=Nocardioides bizhenqiangii TaxID=3095076 RepID=A0ABZ0ZY35_9ACTN|nr:MULTISPECIES: Rossmann fold nucleotide-binding protein [unclassified Nocardioides]MDZ5623160.1 Rossmann fold nucleotide-binding protein [Nocardioides sp. HM23]WQQ28133.1 Rossmann fold nucleotide-binding protein [Nocardioides sp. HM61]
MKPAGQREVPERVVVVRDSSPADPGRDGLYSPDELYDATPYLESLDARAYSWALAERSPESLLSRALHDEGIDQALGRWCATRSLVGVMGGHAALRGSRGYADAAHLGRLLGATRTVATGGGPGAMEAANLGASLAPAEDAALDEGLTLLAAVPTFRPSIDDWVASARRARALWPDPSPTLGVPTWHYGDEPPNLLATAIAKYFRNAQREAILLQICDAGIVFLPGAAGTVQEIFQDACENYYAAEDKVAPMVLVGKRYWTETLPAWPLLAALAGGRAMEEHVHLVDTVDEAASLFAAAS